MEKKYRKVRAIEYVKTGLLFNEIKPFVAERKSDVKVISFSKSQVVFCKADPLTGESVCDETGQIVKYTMNTDRFLKRYYVVDKANNVFKPINSTFIFVPVLTDILIECFGTELKVDAGSYLNITNLDDIYPISEEEFKNLYYVVYDDDKLKSFNING